MVDKIKSIIDSVKIFENNVNSNSDNCLPSNSSFLEDGSILAKPRKDGISRYPYSFDGFNLWVCDSGAITMYESTFTSFIEVPEGNEPKIAFFAGISQDGKDYEPVSLLGVPAQPVVLGIKRYTVFTPKAVYYITETPEIDYCVRAFMTDEKEAVFTVNAINKTDKDLQLYISSFFNPFLRYGDYDASYYRWWKECRVKDNDFIFTINQDMSRTVSVDNFGILKKYTDDNVLKCQQTSSRINYMGGKYNSFLSATPLFKGEFESPKPVCAFSDIACAGDITHFSLNANSSIREEFVFMTSHNRDEMEELYDKQHSFKSTDENLAKIENEDIKNQSSFLINFGKCKDERLNSTTFNNFLEYVKRQVDFCALGKTYCYDLMGIRDVFQQLEALIMWRPQACTAKILEALSYTDPSGRCPRQYSLPAKGAVPKMNLDPFIDQGVWVISTIIVYLQYTKDFDFLNKTCGYYEIVDEASHLVKKSEHFDSVLDHMIKVMDYLNSMRDHDFTKCVRALFGDWNDALDGLGVSLDKDKKYGTGVSVMASLQVYQNFEEMIQLLSIIDKNKYKDKIAEYANAKNEVCDGLKKYAVIENDEGEKRVIHGWGDKRSYLVGSFEDPDGSSRYSLTSPAFWVLSGMFEKDTSIKNTIMDIYEHLDSKYGLKTFEPYFPVGMYGVGRIPKLPAGTAENAAAYIHATMFGIASLYRMGEGEFAFEQLIKTLPITHNMISTSPYVMPNSYCHNEDLLIDGESMNDWYTGSANVLIKVLVRYIFGVEPKLDGVDIQPTSYLPFENFEVTMPIRNCKVTIKYSNGSNGKRIFKVNGDIVQSQYDDIMKIEKLKLKDELFECYEMEIWIID